MSSRLDTVKAHGQFVTVLLARHGPPTNDPLLRRSDIVLAFYYSDSLLFWPFTIHVLYCCGPLLFWPLLCWLPLLWPVTIQAYYSSGLLLFGPFTILHFTVLACCCLTLYIFRALAAYEAYQYYELSVMAFYYLLGPYACRYICVFYNYGAILVLNSLLIFHPANGRTRITLLHQHIF